MNSPSPNDESENASPETPQIECFDQRNIRLFDELSRDVTVKEIEEFKIKYPAKRFYEETFWEELVRAYTLDEELINWAKTTIFPKDDEMSHGFHRLRSTFFSLHTLTRDERFGLTIEQSIIHRDEPTPGK